MFYRFIQNKHDVWTYLETNWIDFFWLTGETPRTLGQLALDIQRQFKPTIGSGRLSSLNFKNQVAICLLGNYCHNIICTLSISD